jgi:putative phosphoesterase
MGVRIALVSDQHANDVAFEAVADDIERIGVDRVVCLGDVAQGGAQPVETLARLRSLGAETVLGNADDFLLEIPTDSPEEITASHLVVREWTLSRLEPVHLELIRGFSPTIELEVEGRKLLCCHGSHRQWTRRIGRALFVNPGSVGVAYDHHQSDEPPLITPVAEYAIAFVDATGVSVEFRRVPYSLERLREVVIASGRPEAERHLSLYRQAN